MDIDYLTFFHQGAMAICSTLNIRESVRKCGEYIKSYIPIDGVGISTFDPDSQGLRIFVLHGKGLKNGRRELFISLERRRKSLFETTDRSAQLL